MVGRGMGSKGGVTAKRYELSFWDNETVLKLILVINAQFCEYIKSHCIL